MNSADKRIEELLNRAGQTISDLPKPSESSFAYSGKLEEACEAAMKFSKGEEAKEPVYFELVLADYILHLTDIIDRFEWALENQVTLHENLMHVISNADIPDGVSYDQFCLVVDSIYKAIQTAQEGWENYEEGVPKDDD